RASPPTSSRTFSNRSSPPLPGDRARACHREEDRRGSWRTDRSGLAAGLGRPVHGDASRRGHIVTDLREKILILEDEKLLRMTMRKRLEDEGYRVFEAATGQIALDQIRDDEPDLLL